MHIHEYQCKKCLHKFVLAHPAGEHDKHQVVKCPKCSSTHVTLCFEPLHAPGESGASAGDAEGEKSPAR